MKKWLITSVCFICFCSTNVSNVINAMDATESARIGAEYLSQIKELKRVQQEHFSILELRNKIERELMADMRATGDQELIAEIDHRSHFCVSGFRGFCYFAFGMPNRRLLCQEIADCEYILLNKYVRLFDNVLAGGDPKWEFLKEQISNRPASSILSYFINSYKYGTEDICPYEFVKSNPLTKDIVDHMYEEFSDWTDSKLDDLYEKYYKKLNVDNKTWEFFRWACFSKKIPSIYNSNIPAETNFYPEYNPGLNKALKRHGELKEQVEILDRIFVEAELADIHERAISNKIAWYLRKHEAICNDALNRSKKEELEQEVYDASRALTPNELKDVTPLMSMIAQKHGISDVRIIDAESLITSMHLPEPEKQRLLYLLKHGSQEEIDAEIHRFLDESEFVDELPPVPVFTPPPLTDENGRRRAATFWLNIPYPTPFEAATSTSYAPRSTLRPIGIKDAIITTFLAGSRYSLVYRNQILALIAWSRANEPKLYDVKQYEWLINLPLKNKRQISFYTTADGSYASYRSIKMNFSDILFLYGIQLNGLSNVIPYHETNSGVAFHEIGHVTSMSIANASDVPLSESFESKSMNIAAESVILERNEAAIAENMVMVHSLPVEKLSQIKESVERRFFEGKSIDQAMLFNFLDALQRSDSLYVRNSFNNPMELVQILGFFSYTYKEQNVFYLNALSDAAACAFSGRSLRVDHDGVSLQRANHDSPTENKILFLKTMGRVFTSKKANLSFYRALVQAFGINPNEYFRTISSYSPYNDGWIIPTKTLSQALEFAYSMSSSFLKKLE